MKKIRITAGNDFTLKVFLQDSAGRPLNVSLIQQREVMLRNRFWEPATIQVNETDDNALQIEVDGASMGRGIYSLEVRGIVEDKKVKAWEPLVFDITSLSHDDIPSDTAEQVEDFVDASSCVLLLKYQFIGVNSITSKDIESIENKIAAEKVKRQQADEALAEDIQKVKESQTVKDLGDVVFFEADGSISDRVGGPMELLFTPGIYKMRVLQDVTTAGEVTSTTRTVGEGLLIVSQYNKGEDTFVKQRLYIADADGNSQFERCLYRWSVLQDDPSAFDWGDGQDDDYPHGWWEYVPQHIKDYTEKNFVKKEVKPILAVHKAIPYRAQPHVWYYFSDFIYIRYTADDTPLDLLFYNELQNSNLEISQVSYGRISSSFTTVTDVTEVPAPTKGMRYVVIVSHLSKKFVRIKKDCSPLMADSYETSGFVDIQPACSGFRFEGEKLVYDCCKTLEELHPEKHTEPQHVRDWTEDGYPLGNKIHAKVYHECKFPMRFIDDKGRTKKLHVKRWCRYRGSRYTKNGWTGFGTSFFDTYKYARHYKIFPCKRGCKSVRGYDWYVNRREGNGRPLHEKTIQ